MRPIPALASAVLALIAAIGPASAFRPPQTNAAFPTEHQRELRDADSQSQPYPMNYSDEAARTLGVHDGHWDAFDTHSDDPLMPSFKGGVDSGAAMLKLQWQR